MPAEFTCIVRVKVCRQIFDGIAVFRDGGLQTRPCLKNARRFGEGVRVLANDTVVLSKLVCCVSVYGKAVVQERGDESDGVLDGIVLIDIFTVAVEQAADRIGRRLRKGTVRIEHRHADGRAGIDLGPYVAVGTGGNDRVVVLAVPLFEVVGQTEPGIGLVTDLYSKILAVAVVRVCGGIIQAIVSIKTAGDIVVEFIRRSGNGEIMCLAHSYIPVQQAEPVCPFREIDIASRIRPPRPVADYGPEITRILPFAVFHKPACGEGLDHIHVSGTRTVEIIVRKVHHAGPGVSVGHIFRLHYGRGEGEIVGIVHHRLTLLGILGGNEDHAVGSPGAVDGGRRRILKHRNGGYIVRVQHGRIPFNSVHQDKGAATLADRSSASDVEICGTDGLAVGEGYVQVRDGALQHLGDVGVRTRIENVASDLLHCTGEVHLALGAITYDHSLFYQKTVFLENYVDYALSARRKSLGKIADAGELQILVPAYAEGIVTVKVSGCSVSGAGDKNHGAGKRSPALVRYGSLYCAAALGLRHERQRQTKSRKCEKTNDSFQHRAAALEFNY